MISVLSHLCCLPFDESGLPKWALLDSILIQLSSNTHQSNTIDSNEFRELCTKTNLVEKSALLQKKMTEIWDENKAQEEVCLIVPDSYFTYH